MLKKKKKKKKEMGVDWVWYDMFIEYFHNLLQKNPVHPLGVAK